MDPVPEIHPVILAAIADHPELQQRTVVYQLLATGKIGETDVELWERLTEGGRKKPPKPRKAASERHPDEPKRSYVNRAARCVERAIRFHGRFIRRQSLAPTLDARLSSGCVRTLNYIVARCGRKAVWETWTVNIAKDLGFCARTVRVHLRTLVDTGYLYRSDPDNARGGCIKLALKVSAETPVWVALKSGADILASLEGIGRNPDSASYETSSSYSLENPERDSFGNDVLDEAEDRGSALDGAAQPLDPPHVGEGRVASPTRLTKSPATGRTGAGHSAKPMRASWASVSSLDDHITKVLGALGLDPANRAAMCGIAVPRKPGGS
jgi:hypothetical protein